MTPQLEALAMLNNMFESFDGCPVDNAILTRKDYGFLVQALTARTYYAKPEASAKEQEPVAWRWRNKGGAWWYREDAPVQSPAAPMEHDADIEPLYGHPWQFAAQRKE